jgi:hypothetical protein
VFRGNLFSFGKGNAGAIQLHELLRHADQTHFDAAEFFVVERVVAEIFARNVGSKGAIDSVEQVQIKSGGYAACIVVGPLKPVRVFF